MVAMVTREEIKFDTQSSGLKNRYLNTPHKQTFGLIEVCTQLYENNKVVFSIVYVIFVLFLLIRRINKIQQFYCAFRLKRLKRDTSN